MRERTRNRPTEAVMAESRLEVHYRDDLTPVCPYCGSELPALHATKRGAPLFQGRTIVFFCPGCRKVLGVGQERVA